MSTGRYSDETEEDLEKLICILGTNASGKSGLGVRLAKHFEGEIVSADSRQVFERLDLGSGKITADEMQGIRHYMLDVAKPGEFYSLAQYQKGAYLAIDEIAAKGKLPFLVGGTGLYVNAVVDGYNLTEATPDPDVRRRLEAMSIEEITELIRTKRPEVLDSVANDNKRRLERAAEKVLMGLPLNLPSVKRYETLELGVTWDREVLRKRIDERLDRRIAEGMIEEVEGLIRDGVDRDFLYRLGLEYRYILLYLEGKYESFEDFKAELSREIKRLAKEQMTWFRKRKNVVWLDMEHEPFERACELIEDFREVI